jgi:DNA-binding CsgD family transcriptional regulator
VRSDPIAVLEAVYRLEGSDEAWVEQTVTTIAPDLDQGLGAMGWTYGVTPKGQQLGITIMRGADAGTRERLLGLVQGLASDPGAQQLIVRGYARGPVGLLFSPEQREDPTFRTWRAGMAQQFGASDILRVSVTDPEGFGFALGALVPVGGRVVLEDRATLSRLATHLRTAMRARVRHASGLGAGEAVLTPDGRIAHCEEGAKSKDARAALREAARDLDRARGRMRTRDPQGAVALWRGLVEGTWTLVDQHESDGRRYVIARRNEPGAAHPLPGLSREEQTCLLYAAMGHSQKLVAYELGLSEPVVSRTLKRAMGKLGIASRSELPGWFAAVVAAMSASAERAP